MINQFTDIFNKFVFQIGHGHGLFMFIILHSLKFRIFRKIRKCKSEMDCGPNKIMFIMIFQCDILLRCDHIIHFAIDTNEIQWNALHCIALNAHGSGAVDNIVFIICQACILLHHLLHLSSPQSLFTSFSNASLETQTTAKRAKLYLTTRWPKKTCFCPIS